MSKVSKMTLLSSAQKRDVKSVKIDTFHTTFLSKIWADVKSVIFDTKVFFSPLGDEY